MENKLKVANHIAEILHRLAPYYDTDEAANWLISPHPQLGNRPALHFLLEDNSRPVHQVLDRLDSDSYI
ncbi:MAG: antitoxin Xre/MbcA/ParS toxin-binding domain-containing protein [Pseudomonadota bacterium]